MKGNKTPFLRFVLALPISKEEQKRDALNARLTCHTGEENFRQIHVKSAATFDLSCVSFVRVAVGVTLTLEYAKSENIRSPAKHFFSGRERQSDSGRQSYLKNTPSFFD